jgi:ATP-dependent Lhr-like helicase
MSTFDRLHPRLRDKIVSELGWTSLRAVQEEAGAALLAGANAVVLAPTAGGKTEASMFPTLSMLLEHPPSTIGAIYIAPIKALLNNQAERLGHYTQMVGLDRFVWHGDTLPAEKRNFIRAPCELLMTTPESLEVMLVSPRVPADRLFADLRMVVIDEIHAMSGTDRGAHLMSVLERLADRSKHDVQRVGLSATVGNPAEILRWLQGSSRRPSMVVDPPKKPTRRELTITMRDRLSGLASDAASLALGKKSLFFCQSRAATEAVAGQMRAAGIEVFVHHSAVSKEERELAEERFRSGGDACIVCTSTLELGIDVGGLDRVLQHQAPDTVSAFLQRMGRTGRREGTNPNTAFFCEDVHAVVQAVALIELSRRGWVEDVPTLSRCWPVLVHQVFAMCLASAGERVSELWRHLSRVPDFAGISRDEFDALLEHMLRELWLEEVAGRLVLGTKAERRFGRKNFMELYAVFSSPQTYTVVEGERALGSLQQDFVDSLVEDVSTFLLGGRAWSVSHINHKDRIINVQGAPRGRRPTWGGHTPQFLGYTLCQEMAKVLTDDAQPPYLHPSTLKALAEHRESFAGLAGAGSRKIEIGDDEVRWWTFAGGRVNATLKYAIEAVSPCAVVADNLVLRVRGESSSGHEFDRILDELRSSTVWDDERFWAKIKDGLPGYRLSKFQDVLPDAAQREMLADFMLDVDRARSVAQWQPESA